jgi:hypothetical protein
MSGIGGLRKGGFLSYGGSRERVAMIVIADAQRGRVGATIIAIWLILLGSASYGIWAIENGQLLSDHYGWQLPVLAFLPVFALPRQIAATRAFLRHAAFLYIDGDRLVQSDPNVFSAPLADVSELRTEGGKLLIIARNRRRTLPGWAIRGGPEAAVDRWRTWQSAHIV